MVPGYVADPALTLVSHSNTSCQVPDPIWCASTHKYVNKYKQLHTYYMHMYTCTHTQIHVYKRAHIYMHTE